MIEVLLFLGGVVVGVVGLYLAVVGVVGLYLAVIVTPKTWP